MTSRFNDLMLDLRERFRVIWQEGEDARRVYEIATQQPDSWNDSYGRFCLISSELGPICNGIEKRHVPCSQRER
jgi:hypothetical protein